eukprot:SAG31_NODE_16129_length_722_cov_0.767255_1_plen_82_part_00
MLTHPAVHSAPLAMLQVAICPEVAGSVDALLTEDTWASNLNGGGENASAANAAYNNASRWPMAHDMERTDPPALTVEEAKW